MVVRLLKDVEFARWAERNRLADKVLREAAREIEAGLIDARLGGVLIKKRVAAPGRGKRGGYRTILGYRQGDRLIFLHGFAKNETSNITSLERKALLKLCEIYMLADDSQLEDMVARKLILEIREDEQDPEERS